MIPTFPTPPGVAKNPGKSILDSDGDDLLLALSAPFHPKDVDWKPGNAAGGSRMNVYPYIDASALRRRLDTVCGLGGWQGLPYQLSEFQTAFALAIWIRGQWIARGDGAFTGDLDIDGSAADGEAASDTNGGGGDRQKNDRRERAKKLDAAAKDAKGAISNAFKRACGAWMMGDYLRDLGKITEETEQARYGRVLTKEARDRLYDLAAGPYYDGHTKRAATHEYAAKKAFDAGDLSTAYSAAKAAYRIRHEVFGADDLTTKAARAFLDQVVARQKGAQGQPPPADAGAAAPASAAPAAPTPPPSGNAMPHSDAAVDLLSLVQRMEAAGTVDELKAASAPGWKAWARGGDDDKAFRAAFEAAMQRFHPGWTIAGAEAAKKQAQAVPGAQPPGEPQQKGGAPPAARAPAGAVPPKGGKATTTKRRSEAPAQR